MDWASDLISALSTKKDDKFNFLFAKVISSSPLKIEINGQIISKNIFVSSGIKPILKDEFKDNPIKSKWFDFIKVFYEKNTLKPSDILIVLQKDINFYVLCKVVRS